MIPVATAHATTASSFTSGGSSDVTSGSSGVEALLAANQSGEKGSRNGMGADGGSGGDGGKSNWLSPSMESESCGEPKSFSALTSATAESTAFDGSPVTDADEARIEAIGARGWRSVGSPGGLASSQCSVFSSLTASLSIRGGMGLTASVTASLVGDLSGGLSGSNKMVDAVGECGEEGEDSAADADADADANAPIDFGGDTVRVNADADASSESPPKSFPSLPSPWLSRCRSEPEFPFVSTAAERTSARKGLSMSTHCLNQRELIHRGRSTRVFRVVECEEEGQGEAAPGPRDVPWSRVSSPASRIRQRSANPAPAQRFVAIKTLVGNPTSDEISRLYNEYHVLSKKLGKVKCVRKAVQKGLDGFDIPQCFKEGSKHGDGGGGEAAEADAHGNGASSKLAVGKHSTVLEWVDGCTLREWMIARPVFDYYDSEANRDGDSASRVNAKTVSPRLSSLGEDERARMLRMLRTLRDVADALASVHEAGVQHNDINADNVIVCAPEPNQWNDPIERGYDDEIMEVWAGDRCCTPAQAAETELDGPAWPRLIAKELKERGMSSAQRRASLFESPQIKIIGLGYASVINSLECDDDGGRVNDDLYALGVLFQDSLAAEPIRDRKCAGDSDSELDEEDAPMGIPGLEDDGDGGKSSARDSLAETYSSARSKGRARRTSTGFVDLTHLGFGGSGHFVLDRGKNRQLKRLHPRAPRPLAKVASDLMEIGSSVRRYRDAREVVEDLDEMLSDPNRFLFVPPGPRPLDLRPDVLYGREMQSKKLLDAYGRVARVKDDSRPPSEVVLLSGPPGAGKSHLVDWTLRPLCRFFISGKFDEYCRTDPYSAILSAFSELCDILINQEDAADLLKEIRTLAPDAIGPNGVEVLVGAVPGLWKVLGEESPPRGIPSSVFSDLSVSSWLDGSKSHASKSYASKSNGGNVLQPQPEVEISEGSGLEVGGLNRLGTAHSRLSIEGIRRRDSSAAPVVNFDEAVRSFLRVVSRSESPIIVFLNDLQWVDEPSLRLIHSILTDSEENGCRLLFVGSYRSGEVDCDLDHPIHQCFREVAHRGVKVSTVDMPQLDRDAVCKLVSDQLQMTTRLVRPLADIVHRRTQGNTLIMRLFLEALCADGLLRFDAETLLWVWDEHAVLERNVSDDVVQHLTEKILRLPPELREVLQILAFVGSSIESSTIKLLTRNKNGEDFSGGASLEHDCDEVAFSKMLQLAVDEGLIDEVMPESATGSSYSSRRCSRNSAPAMTGATVSEGSILDAGRAYRFAHGRIQQAAYSLVPENRRAALHLRIGELIWRNATDAQLFEGGPKLFIMVDQLNRGSDLMDDTDRRDRLAALNLRAGERALSLSANGAAAHYLRAGIRLLGLDGWCRQYDVELALVSTYAEAEYRSGHFERMEDLLNQIFSNAKSLHDQIGAHCALIKSLGARDRMHEAIDVGFSLLERLGEHFPRKGASDAIVAMDLARTKLALRGKSDKAILSLGTLQNQQVIDVMRVISVIYLYIYLARIECLPFVTFRLLRLSLHYGVCEATSFAFAVYGTIHAGSLGDFNEGYRYGQLAMGLLERFKATDWFARVHVTHYACIDHWRRGVKLSIGPFMKAYKVGLKSGDIEYSMMSLQVACCYSFLSGEPLEPLERKSRAYAQIIGDYKQDQTLGLHLIAWQAMLNLMGRSLNQIDLTGEAMDEIAALEVALEKGNRTESCFIYFFRMFLAYYFGEYEVAAQMAKKSRNLGDVALASFITARHPLYESLTAVALARARKRRWMGRHIKVNMAKLRKWSASSPRSHVQGLLLLKAECTALKGKREQAMRLYDAAIDAASKNGFLQDESLANERAGLYHKDCNDKETASRYLARAYSCYKKWGAHAKAEALRRNESFAIPLAC